MTALMYSQAGLLPQESKFATIADFMVSLMLRNFATNTWYFCTQNSDGQTIHSEPGAIIASPSQAGDPETDQDYVHHWVRDAAICVRRAVHEKIPSKEIFRDHAQFSRITQLAALNDGKTVGHAAYRIDGSVRPWSEQSDGPALRIISLLDAYDLLKGDATASAAIQQVVQTDLAYLLQVYAAPTHNLWEETVGLSFFARSVQKRAFEELKERVPAWIPNAASVDQAIDVLGQRLEDHWDEIAGYYRSILSPQEGTRGVNINIDVLLTTVYGERSVQAPRIIRSAAAIRDAFEPLYPINAADAEREIGPLIGRYPEDDYDGDVLEQPNEGHPWPVSTAVFAEFYYTLAKEIGALPSFTITPDTRRFFAQIGVSAQSTMQAGTPAFRDLVAALVLAGDKMLRAVVFHSDHLELNEQNDRHTGFAKSVRNLTWSYAAFISAARARVLAPAVTS